MITSNGISSVVGCLIVLLTSTVLAEKSCERLKSSLLFSQDKAPKDLSGVFSVAFDRINKELDGVKDVQVDYNGGDLHGRVGEHIINCTVTRMASTVKKEQLPLDEVQESRDYKDTHEVIQCFQLPFTIEDTDECALPEGHAMAHQCQAPAMCVNTIGSYECVCPRLDERKSNILGTPTYFEELMEQPRSAWELSFETQAQSSCPSSATTFGCCSGFGDEPKGATCRADFRCPKDPCGSAKDNTCVSQAQCARNESPNPTGMLDQTYQCNCKFGLMGNGYKCRPNIDPDPKPMVKFDGVTPTEETKKNNFYCGCSKPRIDACAGFPPCKDNHEVCVATPGNGPVCGCKPGYVNNNDGYGCVDESPPVLKLRNDPQGDQTLRLKQGDFYKEFAVDIIDENAEDYIRKLRISYSEPLPPGCLASIGSFHVNYTIAIPWASYQFVRVTRHVEVGDVDECSLNADEYKNTCPSLIPQCDTAAGAKCVNTNGSYKCVCPEYSNGDGFQKTIFSDNFSPPEGYNGGTSCVDTSVPAIEILGPNPKIFKVSDCYGMRGIIGGADQSSPVENEELCEKQRSKYGDYIKDLIQSTMGAELCATNHNPNPEPRDCVRATDHSYQGVQDITSQVEIGEPVEKSHNHWKIPYDVVDEAGNKAATAWRDVFVEEVDIFHFEHKLRSDIVSEYEVIKKEDIKEAVEKAISEERMKYEKSPNTSFRTFGNNGKKGSSDCSSCPVCESMSGNISTCDQYCASENLMKSCPSSSPTTSWSNIFLNIITFGICVIVCIFVLKFMLTLMYNPSALFGKTDNVNINAPSNEVALINTHDTQILPSTPFISNLPHQGSNIVNPLSPHRREGGIFSHQSSRLPQQPNVTGADTDGSYSSPFGSQSGYQPSPYQGPSNDTNNFNLPNDGNIYASDIISPSKMGHSRRKR